MAANTENLPVPDEVLPTLTASQCWCCAEGCGKTDPVLTDYNYYEVRDADTGRLIFRRHGKVWASKCCGADIELWDEEAPQGAAAGNFIEWEPVNKDEIDAAAYRFQSLKKEES